MTGSKIALRHSHEHNSCIQKVGTRICAIGTLDSAREEKTDLLVVGHVSHRPSCSFRCVFAPQRHHRSMTPTPLHSLPSRTRASVSFSTSSCPFVLDLVGRSPTPSPEHRAPALRRRARHRSAVAELLQCSTAPCKPCVGARYPRTQLQTCLHSIPSPEQPERAHAGDLRRAVPPPSWRSPP